MWKALPHSQQSGDGNQSNPFHEKVKLNAMPWAFNAMPWAFSAILIGTFLQAFTLASV
ncbi:hypothetical protein Ancab_024427 [Ancistrocladus abbreviatus]